MMSKVVLVFSPNLGRLRQTDLCEFEANLTYIASLEPVSKQQKKVLYHCTWEIKAEGLFQV